MTDTLRFQLTVGSKIDIFQVKKSSILTQLHFFQEHISLLNAGEYTVKSAVSADIFAQFVNFIEGASIEITPINFLSHWSLSKEFGFRELQSACGSFAEKQNGVEGGNALNILGECFEKGYGVDKDFVRAAEYYRLSAEQGNADGQFNFGVCLENGSGVDKDLIRAAEYYRL
jgi:TPR repeat protein